MWSSAFCIRARLSPFPACLPAPPVPAWVPHGAGREMGSQLEERLRAMLREEPLWHHLEKMELELRPGLARGKRRMDVQPGWPRAEEEKRLMVELWDGSNAPELLALGLLATAGAGCPSCGAGCHGPGLPGV